MKTCEWHSAFARYSSLFFFLLNFSFCFLVVFFFVSIFYSFFRFDKIKQKRNKKCDFCWSFRCFNKCIARARNELESRLRCFCFHLVCLCMYIERENLTIRAGAWFNVINIRKILGVHTTHSTLIFGGYLTGRIVML